MVREVRAAGHAVLYVSHRMDEIFELADDLIVLRAGKVVGAGRVTDHTPAQLASLIAGHGVTTGAGPARTGGAIQSEIALSVKGLTGRYLDGLDIEMHKGEVLGIAGLLGSGRDELPYVIAGAVASTSDGPWRIDGREVAPPTSATAPDLGIAFVPAERGSEGLIPDFTVGENLTLGALPRIASAGRLSPRHERSVARDWLAEIGVAADTQGRAVTTLSGGNQQRILLARCLYTQPSILVLSEPTAGVDVGARQALYDLLRERADAGLSILLASSDTEDLVSVCDRILVLSAGRVTALMAGSEIETERIVSATERVT
jgi:ribose transport system ATP-binding protein